MQVPGYGMTCILMLHGILQTHVNLLKVYRPICRFDDRDAIL